MATTIPTTVKANLANIAGVPTITELKAIARKLPYRGDKGVSWYDRIKGSNYDWALLAISTVHAAGASTHATAYAVGLALGRAIQGNSAADISGTPRLSYTRRDGKAGLSSANGGGDKGKGREHTYHPGRFGIRTKLGSDYKLSCAAHKVRYENCNIECELQVTHNGETLLSVVRGDTTAKVDTPKAAPKAKATRKRRKAAKATTDVSANVDKATADLKAANDTTADATA